MADETQGATPEQQAAALIELAAPIREVWEETPPYEQITSTTGIICEVRGIGSNRHEQLRAYIAAANPAALTELLTALLARTEQAREAVHRECIEACEASILARGLQDPWVQGYNSALRTAGELFTKRLEGSKR